MQLTIAHLYPEQMNIYGDRGNILTLRQRCAWRDIDCRVRGVGVGDSVDWSAVDLVFFGGGQDSGQALIADDFVQHQAPRLRAALETGLPLLAICGGYQLLGHYFLTHTGERLPGAGLMDVHTVGGTRRLIGNIVVAWEHAQLKRENGTFAIDSSAVVVVPGHPVTRSPGHPATPSRLVGFENHSGRTYLGAGVRRLGRVLAGHGNNGEDGSEGAVHLAMHGCYMHGSLLPKNPHFADYLLALALERRYGEIALMALDDTAELAAHTAMVGRVVTR